LPPVLITLLLDRARASGHAVTLASVAAAPQTFPVVLGRKALAPLAAELNAGRLGCLRAFYAAAEALGEPVDVIPAERLAYFTRNWFLNVNTPGDLAHAEALLSRRGTPGASDRVS
jgi:molybdopterin-guanine dinucleotide biosynthesis protein A